MTRKDFFARCNTLWTLGFFENRELSTWLRLAADSYFKLRIYSTDSGCFKRIRKHPQGNIAVEEITEEFAGEGKNAKIVNDRAYDVFRLACILDHPCQKCAENEKAWHTRYGFCEHAEALQKNITGKYTHSWQPEKYGFTNNRKKNLRVKSTGKGQFDRFNG